MKILIIEPFFSGSHERWAKEFRAKSSHDVEILFLEGSSWKWRMRGGAVTLARLYREGGYAPDLIVASDMLDLSIFLSLTRDLTSAVKTAVYFHENQLCYPWSPNEKESTQLRRQYGFINFTSALSADHVFFNSEFHMNAFLKELDDFINGFPDHNEPETIHLIRAKSRLLYLGVDFSTIDAVASDQDKNAVPLILWNHRWEYDKGPDEFFMALYLLMEKGHDFEVAILGEHFERIPNLFDTARERLGERVLHFGYVPDNVEYARWLKRADILPVTSNHDFFGSSVVEAIYAGATPILPRRLAYPEHIPAALHDKYLYDGFDDFAERLEAAVQGGDFRASNDSLREHVARYGWDKLAPIYDEAMEDVLSGVAR